ncbi:hypothetical protein ACNVED_13780 [Legionella sp. D16C41]|uniref:hypothetical protein n=1 Tax=Legionella sp. D16C41 TaxID=3402688 RepID=UPI003AF562C0
MLRKNILNVTLYLISFSLSSVAVASAATDTTDNGGSSTTSTTSSSSSTTPSSTTNTSTTPSSGMSTTGSATTQSKDDWLSKLREVVPNMICKNFTQNEAVNNRLKSANIDYNKCVTLIPASFDKCKEKYYADLPATIDQESASKWGRTIGECIGDDFAAKNFSDNRSNSGSSVQELTKDEWLARLKAVVPDLICKGFLQDETLNKRLTEVNINYDKCVTLIPASVDKCQKDLYSQIPATINQQNAGKWGHSIGECIGKDFAIKYLFTNNKQQ